MKNIQAQYQDLLEGKMSKANFMRNIRMQFPQHISPVTSYDDSVKILKGKRILSEVVSSSRPVSELFGFSKSEKQAKASRENLETAKKEIDSKFDPMRLFLEPGSQTDNSGIKKGMENRLRDLGNDLPTVKELLPNLFTLEAGSQSGAIDANLDYNGRMLKGVIPSTFYFVLGSGDEMLDKGAAKEKFKKELEKGINEGRKLREAKKPEGVYKHNPNAEDDLYRGIDHLNVYVADRAIKYELSKMPEITDENYVKARRKVVAKMLKDPDAYKELMVANYKEIKKRDEDLKMKEYKKVGNVDKANELKVVKKDAPASANHVTKDVKKKEKVAQMTQTPKGKLEAFATPGKEKVMALKEHLLEDLTNNNDKFEDIGIGSRVKKKSLKGYDENGVGNVIGFDTHTAIVVFDKDSDAYEAAKAKYNKDGEGEDPDKIYGYHLQKNVLTKKDIPQHPEAADRFGKIPSNPVLQHFTQKEEKSTEEKKRGLREKLMKAVKELLYRDRKTKQVQSFKPGDEIMKDPQFNATFQKV
jgi:hypothetical protein